MLFLSGVHKDPRLLPVFVKMCGFLTTFFSLRALVSQNNLLAQYVTFQGTDYITCLFVQDSIYKNVPELKFCTFKFGEQPIYLLKAQEQFLTNVRKDFPSVTTSDLELAWTNARHIQIYRSNTVESHYDVRYNRNVQIKLDSKSIGKVVRLAKMDNSGLPRSSIIPTIEIQDFVINTKTKTATFLMKTAKMIDILDLYFQWKTLKRIDLIWFADGHLMHHYSRNGIMSKVLFGPTSLRPYCLTISLPPETKTKHRQRHTLAYFFANLNNRMTKDKFLNLLQTTYIFPFDNLEMPSEYVEIFALTFEGEKLETKIFNGGNPVKQISGEPIASKSIDNMLIRMNKFGWPPTEIFINNFLENLYQHAKYLYLDRFRLFFALFGLFTNMDHATFPVYKLSNFENNPRKYNYVSFAMEIYGECSLVTIFYTPTGKMHTIELPTKDQLQKINVHKIGHVFAIRIYDKLKPDNFQVNKGDWTHIDPRRSKKLLGPITFDIYCRPDIKLSQLNTRSFPVVDFQNEKFEPMPNFRKITDINTLDIQKIRQVVGLLKISPKTVDQSMGFLDGLLSKAFKVKRIRLENGDYQLVFTSKTKNEFRVAGRDLMKILQNDLSTPAITFCKTNV